MRLKNKTITECRSCRKLFSLIRGLTHFDNRCCSPQCFLTVGPKKPAQPDARTFKGNTKTAGYFSKGRQVAAIKKGNRNFKKKDCGSNFYLSDAWLQIRYQVLKKYGRTCMACGEVKGSMHVDHIKPRSIYPNLALDFNNLQVLCQDCNLGKLNRDDTDFRPKENTLTLMVDTVIVVDDAKEN